MRNEGQGSENWQGSRMVTSFVSLGTKSLVRWTDATGTVARVTFPRPQQGGHACICFVPRVDDSSMARDGVDGGLRGLVLVSSNRQPSVFVYSLALEPLDRIDLKTRRCLLVLQYDSNQGGLYSGGPDGLAIWKLQANRTEGYSTVKYDLIQLDAGGHLGLKSFPARIAAGRWVSKLKLDTKHGRILVLSEQQVCVISRGKQNNPESARLLSSS